GGLGTRPITASEVTLLPEPDSPTIASVSPASTWYDRPSTAIALAPPVRNSARRPSTRNAGAAATLSFSIAFTPDTPSRLALARIERLANPVAEQVEGEHRQHDGESRIQHDPRRAVEIVAPRGQHGAPLGRRRLGAEA